ncbi:hypothetical protein M406DRAFT_109337 [Cryphonectria parasitica EP155]|uniref:Uncharacterized protein n=1 Tax=Cryphonectria parasitica (strain ATCC 38755 / EP155) TaxID=660469 RepID=A0A9P4Y9K3_CRYP1|nr:uncharacterized protein M406DRAFT_109337 [Cryphonectria parasitica EP155]KAF3769276.1 hypothetical protein M406DRAFT_109337 [Cryphonectria parasitica EP155]
MSHSCTSWGCSGQPCLEPQDQEPLPVLEPPIVEPGLTATHFDFRMLPGELRLRVLQNTHLGPPGTGGYDACFEELLILDGRLDVDNFNLVGQFSLPCSHRRSLHGSSTPPCRCRILPMALFLVDRQMYHEASEVFYSHALFDFYGDDFGVTLAVLRLIPPTSLRRLRRIQFTMTVAQCDGWGAGALASGYPASSFGDMSRVYWRGGPRPVFDYQAGWRAVVSYLAENADLPRLRIIVDMATSGWSFFEVNDLLLWDSLDFGWFRFVYDFYLGVATTLCSLKTLGSVDLVLYPFGKLTPWLEREIMGCRNGYGSLEQLERQCFGHHIPSWHSMDLRLEGSNYHPDP